MKSTQKLLWLAQWYQALDFAGPCVAQLRWLAKKRGFNQRLPMGILNKPCYDSWFSSAPRRNERQDRR